VFFIVPVFSAHLSVGKMAYSVILKISEEESKESDEQARESPVTDNDIEVTQDQTPSPQRSEPLQKRKWWQIL
jgi:hypothetical protein